MEPSNPPRPERFQVYTQLKNGKGFTIKDSPYIYFFDKHGGWYDQFNNYYAPDGEPEDPPSDEDQDFQRVLLQQDQGDDYYEREYGSGPVPDVELEDTNQPTPQQIRYMEAIAQNHETLNDYPLNTPLRVDFENMNFSIKEEEALLHFRKEVGTGILNIFFSKKNNKFSGSGYFVCKDISVARQLIKLQGHIFSGRSVYFNVESLNHLMMDPLNPKEVGYQNQQLLTLDQKAKNQRNIKSTEYDRDQRQQVQDNVDNEWKNYRMDVSAFHNKTAFKNWMQKFGFTDPEHYKNIEKVQSNDPKKKLVQIQLRNKVYNKVNGAQYQGKKIIFEQL